MTATIPTQTGPANEDWRDDALCREIDLGLFFPGKGGSTKDARSVCAACGVREECLAFALSFPAGEDHYGIFGGKSERERARLRRQA